MGRMRSALAVLECWITNLREFGEKKIVKKKNKARLTKRAREEMCIADENKFTLATHIQVHPNKRRQGNR